jgi:predicted unusual protein kinase regulating ubiquinone biosynthesis (AarF/ABC1/UbiB family)
MLTTPAQQFRWQKHKNSALGRQLDISWAALSWVSALGWDKLRGRRGPVLRRQRAKALIATLLDLGPTFIKIGQALSTRGDILPLEYVQELALLQDNVPPFSSGEAIAVIESELGKSLYAVFRDFEAQPIAAASLGQVHRARLHTGEDVVVKVQRPGLKTLFDLDVQALHKLVQFCCRYFAWARKYEIAAIYQEFVNILYQEIDYTIEAKNADRFRANFQDYPGVIVPRIYWPYTTAKVLTIEYRPGVKITDRETLASKGINPKELNPLGVGCYLKQLLIDGFFQADPHPGNMAVSGDGSIIFYDFGMMVEVQAMSREQMIATFFAVLRKDTDAVINSLIGMGLIEPIPDMAPVRRLMDFILKEFTEKPLEIQSLQKFGAEIYDMFEQQPFRLPARMMFILKALTTLDGIARTLDPQYNPIACAKPFVKNFTNISSRGDRLSMIKTVALQAKDLVTSRFSQPSRLELRLQSLETRLDRGELQIRVKSASADRLSKETNLILKSLLYIGLVGFGSLTGAVLLLGSFASWAALPFTIALLSCPALLWHLWQVARR